MEITKINDIAFFEQNALSLAPQLLGKYICRRIDGETMRLKITEAETYMGGEDLACHASKGKTERTSVMFEKGGVCYVYLVYGMHNMFNVVCGAEGSPEAVLIRCCKGFEGPAKLTKRLKIDRSLNRISLIDSDEIWLEDAGEKPKFVTKPRVGVAYAGEYWANVPWRFVVADEND